MRVLHLPSPIASIRHSLPALVGGVVGPFAAFYVVFLALGARAGLIASLAWCACAFCHHLVRGQRPSGTLILTTAVLAARTAIALATGSMFFYFAQPAIGTALVAVTFLSTALAGRPLIAKLARDFCPLDPALFLRPSMRRFFLQISVLWGSVLLANAGFTFWLLVTSSMRAFPIERTATNWGAIVVTAAISTAWFVRSMRRDGVRVRFGAQPAV